MAVTLGPISIPDRAWRSGAAGSAAHRRDGAAILRLAQQHTGASLPATRPKPATASVPAPAMPEHDREPTVYIDLVGSRRFGSFSTDVAA